MNILSFDIGTTSMRGILYDETGKQLAEAGELTPLIYKGTYIEQDPLFLKEKLFAIAKKIRKEYEVDAIVLTAFRSAPALFDLNGQPLSNFIMWQDTRNRSICEELMPLNPMIYEKTGSKVNAVFMASKVTWLKRNCKEAYDKAYKVMVVPAYLLYLMTGEWNCDVTYGSRTGLMDLHCHEYDDELLKIYDLDKEKLAQLVPVGSIVGYTRGEFVEECGIKAGLPVISSGGDQQNSALGLGELDPSSLVINCGTGGFVISLNDSVFLDNDALICNDSAIPGKYILESNVLASAAALNWVLREFFSDIWNDGDPDFEAFHEIVMKSPLGSNGVLCVPLFQGCGSRDWNPDARASFTNISLGNTRGDLGRAVLEGIAAEITKSVRSLPRGTDRDLIYIGGGLTKSSFFDHILCDMLGVPLLRYEDAQSTAIGSFVSAAVTLGLYPSYEEAFRQARSGNAVYRYDPDPKNHEEYQKLIERSEEVYKLL